MSKFEEYVKYRALAFKFQDVTQNSTLLEHAIDQLPETDFKHVSAKLSAALVERLDKQIQILDMSKRQFIEIALIDALDRVEQINDELDIFSRFEKETAE